MKKLIHYALNQPLFIVLGTLLFALAGFTAFKNLSVEAFPDVTDTQVTVIALYPGRAAEEVEKQVTLPLEANLSGLPNSIRVFSHTQFGLSFTVITFDDNANVNLARQQVYERLRSVNLPPGADVNVAPNATPVGEIMRYRLRGDGKTTTELRSTVEGSGPSIASSSQRCSGIWAHLPIGPAIRATTINEKPAGSGMLLLA